MAYLDQYKGKKLVFAPGLVAGVYLMPHSLVDARDPKPWVPPSNTAGATTP